MRRKGAGKGGRTEEVGGWGSSFSDEGFAFSTHFLFVGAPDGLGRAFIGEGVGFLMHFMSKGLHF